MLKLSLLSDREIMAKIILILFAGIAICIIAAWYLIPKFLEQPAYKIVQKDGKIELRDYDTILLQSVKVSGQQYDALRKGFRPLVSYIGAKSREGEKISMTAPVIQSLWDDENAWSVSFSMPAKYKISDLPNPNNERIYTEAIPAFRAAVIRFSGRADMSLLTKKTKELRDWIESSGLSADVKPRYMFYNDPSTPPFMRRNEVLIEIQ